MNSKMPIHFPTVEISSARATRAAAVAGSPFIAMRASEEASSTTMDVAPERSSDAEAAGRISGMASSIVAGFTTLDFSTEEEVEEEDEVEEEAEEDLGDFGT